VYKVSLTFTFTFTFKVSSATLNSVLHDSQTFASQKADFRYVTGHSVLRYGQNLHTSQRVPTTYNTNSTRALRAILLWAQPVTGLAPDIKRCVYMCACMCVCVHVCVC